MQLHQHFIPGLAIASYIVGDDKTHEAAVIDPPRDVEPLIQFARQHDLHIRHIIETHVHADFVCGSRELRARLHDRPTLHCSGYGGEDWTQPFADEYLREGQPIEMGDVRLGARHVPGHTPEHIAIEVYDRSRSAEVPWVLLTGDFLFVGDVGRPDLLGEKHQQELAEQLYHSIFERLDDLPDFTEIYPAHGAGSLCGKAIGSRRSSTLGFERRFNASLQNRPQKQWIEQLLDEMPLSPPYFQRMKRVNREGPAIIGEGLTGQKRWNVKSVHERVCEDCLILDVRSKEAFAAAHIPGAINIPYGGSLPTWAGWVLPYERPILLVVEEPGQVEPCITHLLRVGFDDIHGYLEGGLSAWETAGYSFAALETLSVQDLERKRKEEQRLTVLDVRTQSEWNAGHIPDALHVHGGVLSERLDEIPRDQPVAVVCGSGYRAAIAASFLEREGFSEVANVLGGMTAWKAAGLPLTQAA